MINALKIKIQILRKYKTYESIIWVIERVYVVSKLCHVA
jgi:hypothetical protein